MTDTSDRLLLLNIGAPSQILSIAADGTDLQVVVADAGVAPDGVAVDAGRRRVYWTCMGSDHQGEDFFANDGWIACVDLDGGARTVLVPPGRTRTPKQLQCDTTNGYLYWCDREGMRVMRARLDGSEVTVLVQTGSTEADQHHKNLHCVGVAIDPEGGFLYWTQKGKTNGDEGRIYRAQLDLPTGMDPAHRSDTTLMFGDLPEPIDLEWEPTQQYLYWTDRGDPPSGNTLNRAKMSAGRPGIREIILTGLQEGIGLAIDAKRGRVFVSDLGGFVRVMSLDHPDAGQVVFSGHGPLTGIAYLDA